MIPSASRLSAQGCGYEYSPAKGDPEWPVAKGTKFQVRRAGTRVV